VYIPLTAYARREIALFGGLGLLVTAAVAIFSWPHWYAALAPAAITAWAFSFFRDPNRRVPQGPRLILAPADGRITHIETIDAAPPELGTPGPALRLSIFLSVFNCHLNRAPCAGRVERIVYKPGRYVNALRGDSAVLNEQNILILTADAVGRPVLVRQVSGAIARRIVCAAHEGDHLETGQRFGMIKFGSRTDLVIPADVAVDLGVKVGDRVKAGLTILGRFSGGDA
jgi:phosphatidylserine decarboxylase